MTAKQTKRESLGKMVARSSVWTGIYRGTATLGIGAILYMQQNYTPREKFEDHKVHINEKLDRLSRGLEAIEQEIRMLNRKQRNAAMAIPER